MASTGSSKIPKMSRPVTPLASPRSRIPRQQVSHNDAKSSSALSSPRQGSLLPKLTLTKKSGGEINSPGTKRHTVTQKQQRCNVPHEISGMKKKDCSADVSVNFDVTGKGEGDLPSLATAKVDLDHFKESEKEIHDDDLISREEVDDALIGLIRPTSNDDFGKYLHLTTISEDKDFQHEELREEDKSALQTTVGNLSHIVEKVVGEDKPTEAKLLMRKLSNPPVEIFNAEAFSQCAENDNLVPAAVRSKIENHAKSLFDELATAAAKKSTTFNIDCDNMAELASEITDDKIKQAVPEKEPHAQLKKDASLYMAPNLLSDSLPHGSSGTGPNSTNCCPNLMHKPAAIAAAEMMNDAEDLHQVIKCESFTSIPNTLLKGNEVTMQAKLPLERSQNESSLPSTESRDGDGMPCTAVENSDVTCDKLPATMQQNNIVQELEELSTMDVEILYESMPETVNTISCTSVPTTAANEEQFVKDKTEKFCPFEHESDEEEPEIVQFVTVSDDEKDERLDVEETNVFHGLLCNGCAKKTKTIFSVDAPLDQYKIASGPGENGDGRGVHSPPTMSKTGESKTNASIVQEYYYTGEEYSAGTVTPRKSVSCADQGRQASSQISDGPEAVINKAVSGIVENWATGVKHSFSCGPSISGNGDNAKTQTNLNGTTECKCMAFVARNVILRREKQNNEVAFRKLVPISNPTSSLYAFKICCEASSPNFTVSPKIGLLRPNSTTFVEVKAKTVEKRNDDKIEIKIFPSVCTENDAEKIEKSYQHFSSKCPNLLHTQTIDRIMIWDGGDLKQRLEYLNSILNEAERAALKEELRPLDQEQDNESTKTLLRSIRRQIHMANAHLKETFNEIVVFRKTQSLVLFLCVLVLIASAATPIRHLIETRFAPVPEPTWLDKILKGLYLK